MPLAGSCLVCLRLTVQKQVCQVKLHILRFDVPPSQISDVGRSLLGKLLPQAHYCGVFCGKQWDFPIPSFTSLCSVIIICGTISCFQELLQCWTSMLWVFFFSLCSILYDPEDIILCLLFSSSVWRRWHFLSRRLLWKLLGFWSPLPDGGCYERAKHLAVIDLFVRKSWCYFRDLPPPCPSE